MSDGFSKSTHTMRNSGDAIVLDVVGALSGASGLPDLKQSGIRLIKINLSKVTHINSAGIREWITWLRQIQTSQPTAVIHLDDVPNVFIRQVPMVNGLFPDNSVIRSFEVPYFCDKCELQNLVWYRLGTEYKGDGTPIKIPEKSCDSCNGKMDPDFDAKSLFASLSKYGVK